MLRTMLALVIALVLCAGSLLAAQEEQPKAVEASVVKVEGDKVTLKVGDKETTLDFAKDKVKIMRGKEEAKLTDLKLKAGDKIQVNQNKEGKITTIRLPEK
jgi:hypothetical protein